MHFYKCTGAEYTEGDNAGTRHGPREEEGTTLPQ